VNQTIYPDVSICSKISPATWQLVLDEASIDFSDRFSSLHPTPYSPGA
jgi:hypothetical protein